MIRYDELLFNRFNQMVRHNIIASAVNNIRFIVSSSPFNTIITKNETYKFLKADNFNGRSDSI